MRVALFSSTVDARDGYGNITFELARELAAQGIDLTLFLPRAQRDLAERLQLPFPVRCVLPPYIYRVYQPKVLGYLRTIDLSGFDLVHSLFEVPYCVPAARAARKAGLPFIVGAQGTYGVWPLTLFPERHLLQWTYRRAVRIVVPSRFTKEMIGKYAGRAYPIDVIHNGVRYDRFRKPADAAALRARFPGKTLLLTVGGLKERKGQDLVIRALPAVRARHPDIAYLIVGKGNTEPCLRDLARSLGVEDCVHFLGVQTGEALVSAFQACDIYVHTPRVTELHFEGFGIVYLEASACGKPIVAADAGGIRDAVLDGETGLIAPDGDVPGIAERILRLCGDPALRQTLGEAGRRYAEQNDWSVIARRFINLYDAVRA